MESSFFKNQSTFLLQLLREEVSQLRKSWDDARHDLSNLERISTDTILVSNATDHHGQAIYGGDFIALRGLLQKEITYTRLQMVMSRSGPQLYLMSYN